MLAPGSRRSSPAIPLFSVLYMLIVRGGARLELGALHASCRRAGFEMGGGFGNAIVGTLVMVGIAGLHQHPARRAGRRVSSPSWARTAGCAQVARFATKTLTGHAVDPRRRVRLRRRRAGRPAATPRRRAASRWRC